MQMTRNEPMFIFTLYERTMGFEGILTLLEFSKVRSKGSSVMNVFSSSNENMEISSRTYYLNLIN